MSFDTLAFMKSHHADHILASEHIVITDYHTLSDKLRYKTSLTQNLMILVTQGTKTIHKRQKSFTLSAGEALLLLKDDYLLSEHCEDGNYKAILIFFSDAIASKLLSQLNPSPSYPTQTLRYFRLMPSPLLDLTRQRLEYIFSISLYDHEEWLALLLQEILLLILQSPEGRNFLSTMKKFLAPDIDLMTFFQNHFLEEWTLNDFAHRSGRSLSALKVEWSRHNVQTPMQWVWDQRLEHAKLLIEREHYRVGDAARHCCFKSHAHFTKMFKKRFGYTPNMALERIK